MLGFGYAKTRDGPEGKTNGSDSGDLWWRANRRCGPVEQGHRTQGGLAGCEQGDLLGQGSPEGQLELGAGEAQFKKGNSKQESGQERMATPVKTSGWEWLECRILLWGAWGEGARRRESQT